MAKIADTLAAAGHEVVGKRFDGKVMHLSDISGPDHGPRIDWKEQCNID